VSQSRSFAIHLDLFCFAKGKQNGFEKVVHDKLDPISLHMYWQERHRRGFPLFAAADNPRQWTSQPSR